jgi:hypothetical protein
MNRRKSLKILSTGALATGAVISGCNTPETNKTEVKVDKPAFAYDRAKEEIAREQKLQSETFFTPHEMETITILADIIIPKDDISGSASEAKVPDFIEFIVKDMPQHQTPMRGGLRWLDVQCLNKFNNPFKKCTAQQQIELIDAIAYPQKAKPEMAQGVAFFNLMRNLTASGFYTSQIGVKDLGYAGNMPNQWNGVPDEVLKQYKLAYTEKELKECISF